VPIEIGAGAHTLVLRATDGAGNVTTSTLQYVINQPATPLQTSVAPLKLATPVPIVAKASSLTAGGLRASRTIRLRQARSRGIAATFSAPAGARVARVRLINPGSGKSVAAKLIDIKTAGRQTVHLRVRGAKAGRYRLEVAVGRSASALTKPVTQTVTLTR
jgi:hypothetical protein